MDSTDDFTNVSDSESEILHYEIFQSTYSENSSSSNKLDEAIGEKRKYVDSVEENIPSKKLCKDDTAIFANPNSTGSDQSATNYFFESSEDDAIFKEQSYENTDDTMFNLTPFARRNINTVNYRNTTGKKMIVSDSEDEYGTPILKFPERIKQLKGIGKSDLTLSDDDELKNDFNGFFENMKNQNISETSATSKMTITNAKSSTPSFSMSKAISAMDTSATKLGVSKSEINQSLSPNQSPKRNVVETLFAVDETPFRSQSQDSNKNMQIDKYCTSSEISDMNTSGTKWSVNETEINQSLSPNQSPKRNVAETLFAVDETPFGSQSQDSNKGIPIDEYCASLGLQPIAIRSNNENIDIKTEEIDQKYLDYMDTNEPFAEDSIISDSSVKSKSEEKISNISKCDKTFMVSDDDPFAKTATGSHSSTLVEQDSQNSIVPDYSKFSVGDCGFSITEQQPTETIHLQNFRDQIIIRSDEQSNGSFSSGMQYIDVNRPSLKDYYSSTKTSVIPNLSADKLKQDSQNNIVTDFSKFSVGDCGFLITKQLPTEAIHLQNTRDEIIAKSEEQSNSNCSSEIHYADANVERPPGKNEISNESIVQKNEEIISNPSKCNKIFKLSDGCSCVETTTIFNTDIQIQQEASSNNLSDFEKFSDRAYDVLPPDQSSTENIILQSIPIETKEWFNSKYSCEDTTVNVKCLSGENETSNNIFEIESREPFSNQLTRDIMQTSFSDYSTIKTIPKQTIVNKDEVSNRDENEKLSSTQIITLQNFPDQIIDENIKQSDDKSSSEVYNMDVNVERLACENKISNIIKETQIEELVPKLLTYNTMQPSRKDSSSSTKISVIPNVDVDKQNEFPTDFIPGKQSNENIKPQNVSDQAAKTAEEVSNVNNKEQSANKRIRNRKKTTKKDDSLKEADFDKIRTTIHNLIEKYIKNEELVDFTLHDVTEFITKRMPNVTHFKVIHAVRLYFMSSLKCGVLKQVGQKYALTEANH